MSNKEYATVISACEVSFQVGHMNYGTINVPVGTKCFRHAGNKGFGVKPSEWFVMDVASLCPEGMKIDGKPSDFFIHDADHYGITMPNANVREDGEEMPKATHKAFHY